MDDDNPPPPPSTTNTITTTGNNNAMETISTDGQVDVQTQQQAQPSEMPMSMMASLTLTRLPRDTTQAIREVDSIDDFKVIVRFSALPSAPTLPGRRVAKISASQRFEFVVNYLRKQLGVGKHQALCCYVNSVFAPGLDEGVGNLFRCFKTDDQLNVSYSMTPAFG